MFVLMQDALSRCLATSAELRDKVVVHNCVVSDMIMAQ